EGLAADLLGPSADNPAHVLDRALADTAPDPPGQVRERVRERVGDPERQSFGQPPAQPNRPVGDLGPVGQQDQPPGPVHRDRPLSIRSSSLTEQRQRLTSVSSSGTSATSPAARTPGSRSRSTHPSGVVRSVMPAARRTASSRRSSPWRPAPTTRSRAPATSSS